MVDNSIHVTYFHRKPDRYSYSIERLFAKIRVALPADIKPYVWESRFLSRGLWRRLWNILEAVFHQGDVNHITGDVHYLAYLLDAKKTVLTIHDCVGLESLRGIKRSLLWLLWYWLPMRRAGVVTVISESSKRELLKYIPCDPAKLYVIHNCIPEDFLPAPARFNADCPRILQIGTTPNKNIERVAAALVGITCRWAIVGRLSDAQRLRIEQLGIDYENHVGLSEQALREQYCLADLLVFASTYEGFGLPIVEANAIGRPVVTSNLYSMPEVAGDAACLVDPYDVQSIRGGITRMIEDTDYREKRVAAGFRNVERFRPAAIAGQYAALYRALINQAKAAS
jgi:glycosyltransferase involved in cell wall biosynthesis